MRRGLLAWDRNEVSKAALDARVARLQGAMAAQGIDCVLVYTSFPRPSGVSFLTHFVPYWSQGLLAVFPDGAPDLLVSLSRRVAGWIAETANIDDVICTPALGASTAELIARRAAHARRVGVVELAKLPGGIGHPLQDGLAGSRLEDASALFAAIRHPADAAEIALSRRAESLARSALDALAGAGFATTGALIAALEAETRLGGAEEVIVTIAPDLAADRRLRRMEGCFPLGARHAVRLALAYKGHWVRLARSFGDYRAGEAAASWIARAAPGIRAGRDPADALRRAAPDGVTLAALEMEACTGCAPLPWWITISATRSTSRIPTAARLPTGAMWARSRPTSRRTSTSAASNPSSISTTPTGRRTRCGTTTRPPRRSSTAPTVPARESWIRS